MRTPKARWVAPWNFPRTNSTLTLGGLTLSVAVGLVVKAVKRSTVFILHVSLRLWIAVQCFAFKHGYVHHC
jgi:hypothetical protein